MFTRSVRAAGCTATFLDQDEKLHKRKFYAGPRACVRSRFSRGCMHAQVLRQQFYKASSHTFFSHHKQSFVGNNASSLFFSHGCRYTPVQTRKPRLLTYLLRFFILFFRVPTGRAAEERLGLLDGRPALRFRRRRGGRAATRLGCRPVG